MSHGVHSPAGRKGQKKPEPGVQALANEAPAVEPSFFRNKRVAVDSLEGDALKAYARTIGVSQRDVDHLSQDRLRQNCKAKILEAMED